MRLKKQGACREMRKEIFESNDGGMVLRTFFCSFSQLFHQMTFAVAVHGRFVFVFTKLSGYAFGMHGIIQQRIERPYKNGHINQ
jgi:hypothetical protein